MNISFNSSSQLPGKRRDAGRFIVAETESQYRKIIMRRVVKREEEKVGIEKEKVDFIRLHIPHPISSLSKLQS